MLQACLEHLLRSSLFYCSKEVEDWRVMFDRLYSIHQANTVQFESYISIRLHFENFTLYTFRLPVLSHHL